MKIIHVVPGPLHKGGVGTLVGNLCESLAKQGNSVTAYYVDRTAIYQHERESMHGVSVKGVRPIIGGPFYVPPLNLIKDLERENADIIHIHNIHTLLPLYIITLKKRLSEKMILQPHYHERGQNIARNMLFSVYKKVLKATVFRYFDAIIANSEYEKTGLERDFPSISSKVVLVPEEYSLKVLSHVKWKPATQPRLLYVGALSKYKNVEILIHSLKILTLKRKDIELVIIGDGPERQRLMELALRLDVYDKITLKNGLPYNELLQEYAAASVVVLLSTLESFSRVAHEAVAVGTPLIVYNYGPLSVLVNKGLAKGVQSLDPKEVADVINKVLNNEWKTARLESQLNSEAYINLIIRLYESLLK